MLTSPQNSPAPEMSAVSNSKPGSSVAEGLAETRKRIAAAALRYGQPMENVKLLAVSKQQGIGSIRALAMAGQRDFGESYLQEALPKIDALKDLALTWHYVGQIQSNKTRAIAERFAWVHTVDRLKIAERLHEQRPAALPQLDVCIQVRLEDEPGKGGAHPDDLESLAKKIVVLSRLRLRGLMCIPPPRESFDEQYRLFQRTAALQSELKARGLSLDTLSMGMSGDLEAAIAAGATIVRVGTGIFGERSNRDTRRETRDTSE